MTRRLIPICVGLIASNYLYQWFGPKDWATAFDRSWFEFGTIFCVWLSFKLMPLSFQERDHG